MSSARRNQRTVPGKPALRDMMASLVTATIGWWLKQAISIRVASASLAIAIITCLLAFLSASVEYYDFATGMASIAILSAFGMTSAGIVSFFTARNFWFRR